MRHSRSILVAALSMWAVTGEADIAFQTGTITGSFTTNAGIATPGMFVRATNTANNTSTQTWLDSHGAYSLNLPVGPYRLDAVYENATVGTATVSLDTTGLAQDFRFAAGTMRVHVTRTGADDVGAPLQITGA